MFKKFSLRSKAKTILIIVHAILVTTIVFYIIAGHHETVEDFTAENFSSFAYTVASLLVEPFIINNSVDLVNHLNTINNNPYVIFAGIYDTEQNLIEKVIDPDYDELNKDLVITIDENNEQIFREIGHPEGFFHKEGHFYEIIVPIVDNSNKIGYLQLGVNTIKINQRVAEESTKGIIIIVSSIVIGLVLITLIDVRIRKILNRFIGITQKMANGDLSEKINIKTGDELEDLGNSFNIMAEEIKEREEIIEKHRSQLQVLVEDRTKELSEEKDKLKALLDHVPSIIIMVDDQLKVQMVNSQFEYITKLNSNEVLGKDCTEYLIKGKNNSLDIIKETINDGKIRNSFIDKKNGSTKNKYFEHLVIPLKKGNKVYGALIILTDITEKYQLQDQLIRAEKLSTTGEIAAILSHEIRNSLTSLKMILQVLNESVKEKDKKSISVALESILPMEKIVDELLDFSKPTKINKTPCNLNEILKECYEFTELRFKKKNVEVKWNLDTDLKEIFVDRDYMKEVFTNILINALQSIDEAGGYVNIKTEKTILDNEMVDYSPLPSEPEKITFQNKINKLTIIKGTETIFIGITDSGNGIKEKDLDKVFEPFFTTKLNGTGLGLSLAKRIINAHDGIITVDSDVNKGTKIEIILPCKDN